MLRDYFLSSKIKKNLKKRKDSGNCQFSSSARVGVFFNVKEFDYEPVKELVSKLQEDAKEVNVLGYIDKLDGPVLYDTVVKSEISSSGSISSNEFQKFTKVKYDFLIVLSYNTEITFEYLISECSASCKVGLFSNEEQSNHYDLQLRTEKGQEIRDIYKYIQKID